MQIFGGHQLKNIYALKTVAETRASSVQLRFAEGNITFQHVRCAAPLYRNFTYENCNCDPGLIQYANPVRNPNMSGFLFILIFDGLHFYGIGQGCLSVTFEVEHIMYGKWREPQYAQSYLGNVFDMVSFVRHRVIYDFLQKRMSTEMQITHHIPKKYALHHFSLLVCSLQIVVLQIVG